MSAPAVVTCIACRVNPTDGGLQCRACLEGKTLRQSAGSGAVAHKPVSSSPIGEHPAAPVRTRDPARADVLEADEQGLILELLALHGWRTWRIGQFDPSGKRGTQDPGPSDIYAMHRRWGALWVEVKRPHGGELSTAQIEFRDECRACRVPHVWGALPAVQAYLAGLTQPL